MGIPKQTEAYSLDAHGRHAQAVHFTPDGKRLLSAGQDAAIRIWSVPKFQPVGVIEGHTNSVNSLSLDPEGRRLVTGSTDKTVCVWSLPLPHGSLSEGRRLFTFDKQVFGMFSPAGETIATLSPQGDVAVWSADDGRSLAVIKRLERRTIAVAFHPDGRHLYIAGMGPIHRVEIATQKVVGRLAGHMNIVACLRVSPDGATLASTGADGFLRLWSTVDDTELHRAPLAGPGVQQIAFWKDTVAVSADFRIALYDRTTGGMSGQIEAPVKGVYGVAFSLDGKWLANAAADGRVRIWRRK